MQATVTVNTDLDAPHSTTIPVSTFRVFGKPKLDLLGQTLPIAKESKDDTISYHLEPGARLTRAVVWDGETVPANLCASDGVFAGGSFHACSGESA